MSISLATRRFFSTSRVTCKHLNHFDTFKFVERLEKEQFTRQQSEAIMTTLTKVINQSMTDLTKPMVSRAEKDKVFSILSLSISCISLNSNQL